MIEFLSSLLSRFLCSSKLNEKAHSPNCRLDGHVMRGCESRPVLVLLLVPLLSLLLLIEFLEGNDIL
jgi:hypothetical protein